MTSNSSSNENSCQNCASLRALLEQKEAIVTKYQKIVQSQNELLHDLTQKNNSGGSSAHKKINYHGSRRITSSPCSPNGDTIKNKHYGKQVQINNFRAFVGSVTEDIDEVSLKKSLEEAFGEVENIDIIPTKNCAFVDFSPISYHQAVSIGAVMVNGVTLSVERVRRHKSRK